VGLPELAPPKCGNLCNDLYLPAPSMLPQQQPVIEAFGLVVFQRWQVGHHHAAQRGAIRPLCRDRPVSASAHRICQVGNCSWIRACSYVLSHSTTWDGWARRRASY